MTLKQKRFIRRTFVKQLYQSDCGIACLQSVLQYYGMNDIPFESLRSLSGTTKQGTNLLGLYEASIELGFEAIGLKSSVASLKSTKELTILHVIKDETLEHYVLFYGIDKKNRFIIGDPAEGLKYFDQSELEKIWVSKKCLKIKNNRPFNDTPKVFSKKLELIFSLVRNDLNSIISSAIIGILVAGLSIITAVVTQKLIDNILPSKNFNDLLFIASFFLFILCFQSLLSYVRASILIKQSKFFNQRIISTFYKSLMNLPKLFFDTRATGDMVVRLNDTLRIQNFITNVIGNSLIDFLMLIASLTFVLYYSHFLFFFSISVFSAFYTIIQLQTKKVLKKQKAIMATFSQVEVDFIDTIQGIAAIKGSNQEQHYLGVNNKKVENHQDKVYDLSKLKAKLNAFNGIVTALYLSLVLLLGSYMVIHDEMQLGVFMAIFGLCSASIPFIVDLAMIIIPFNEALSAFDRIYELTSVKPEDKEGKEFSSFNSIEISKLSFNYAGKKTLLSNVSFQVRIGEIISIVGENGSGKSTLAQLISRFYKPKNGTITVNNHTDIDSINLSQWRDTFSVASQDVHLFNGTIIENIALNNSQEKINDTIEVLKEINLFGLFDQFSESIWTYVGETGRNISGGQRQLIGIARALVNKSKLIILDEATSAMDIETESKIITIIKGLKINTAFIFISHKIHILKDFSDRIYILEGGMINHYGSHKELMTTNNLYSRFWNRCFNFQPHEFDSEQKYKLPKFDVM